MSLAESIMVFMIMMMLSIGLFKEQFISLLFRILDKLKEGEEK